MNNQSITTKDLLFLVLPFLAGVLSLCIWWFSFDPSATSNHLDWINQVSNMPHVVILIVVLVYLFPQIQLFKIPFFWSLFYIFLLSATASVGFVFAKNVFIYLYQCRIDPSCIDNTIALSVWKLLGLTTIVSLVFFAPIRHFHDATDGLHVFTIMVAIIGVIPMSLISIEWLNWGDHAGAFVFVQATHLGYPVFWLPILLGLFSVATAKEWV